MYQYDPMVESEVQLTHGPDGRQIASVSTDQTLRMWDATSFEELAVLPVDFDRYMGAAVQVGMNAPLEADGKSAAGLARVHHIEGHGQAAFVQIGAGTQGNCS